MKDDTKAVGAGRGDQHHFGAVNMPVYHASTILYPTLAALRDRAARPYRYGRNGTPTTDALQQAVAELEGAAGCVLTPSGLSAVAVAILSVVQAGDHILVADSVYSPTKTFCDGFLKQMGVETQYYDPLASAAEMQEACRPNTSLIFCEAPGSHGFEMQDIPALVAVAAAHKGEREIKTAIDNTWGSCLNFKPLKLGLDICATAATKYIVGHADALLGTITANAATLAQVQKAHKQIGLCAAPDDVFLALRGIRTLPLRLAHHQASALAVAEWLAAQPCVRRVLFPALPQAEGFEIWQRDFDGAAGLFSIELEPCSETQLAAMLDGMAHFSMGYSWGGFESLIVPCDFASRTITAERFNTGGQYLRLHIGLEDVGELIADLSAGLERGGYAVQK